MLTRYISDKTRQLLLVMEILREPVLRSPLSRTRLSFDLSVFLALHLCQAELEQAQDSMMKLVCLRLYCMKRNSKSPSLAHLQE